MSSRSPRDDGGPPPDRGEIDPDVDLRDPQQRAELGEHRWVLSAVALGGVAGALARHGLEVAWPPRAGAFPWTTFWTNVAGCAAIGLLMVYAVETGPRHPLVRPSVGTGVLGGFTTFSTYAAQTAGLVDRREPTLALVYLLGSAAAALAAVWLGVTTGRLVARRVRAGRERVDRSGRGLC